MVPSHWPHLLWSQSPSVALICLSSWGRVGWRWGLAGLSLSVGLDGGIWESIYPTKAGALASRARPLGRVLGRCRQEEITAVIRPSRCFTHHEWVLHGACGHRWQWPVLCSLAVLLRVSWSSGSWKAEGTEGSRWSTEGQVDLSTVRHHAQPWERFSDETRVWWWPGLTCWEGSGAGCPGQPQPREGGQLEDALHELETKQTKLKE